MVAVMKYNPYSSHPVPAKAKVTGADDDPPEELDHAAHRDQGEQLPVLLPHDGEVV